MVAAVLNIALWAWEYFEKPLLLHTVHQEINKCILELYYAVRKLYISSVQKHCQLLWAQADLRWSTRQRTCTLW